jgi:hypothetical protein
MGYAGNIVQCTKCDPQHTLAHGERQGPGTILAISHGSSEIIDLLPGSVTNQLLLPEIGCSELGMPPQQQRTLLDMTLWLQLQLCLAVIGYAGYPLSRYPDIIAEKPGLSASLIGLMLLHILNTRILFEHEH